MSYDRIRAAAATVVASARRRGPALAVAGMLVIMAIHADPAHAQLADPFATAKAQATQIQASLQKLASVVGMIGITICLMLGYFNKLSWKWLATGIGVSFALNVVPGVVQSLASFAGG